MGAAHARGEFLAFTDDDCLVEPEWLRIGPHPVGGPECTGRRSTVNAAPGICATTSQLIVDVVYRHYNSDPEHARFIASNNMTMALREFRDVGGFDPSFRHAEDRELCDRWREQGRRIVYARAARVSHARPMKHAGVLAATFQLRPRRRAIQPSASSTRVGIDDRRVSRFHLDIRNWLGIHSPKSPCARLPRSPR